MGLFKKETPALEPDITGTEAIRRRVWSRWKKANLANTSRDLHIPLAPLEDFATGKGNLPVEHMHKLCREFYPYHTSFDPERDCLVDTSPPAAKGGTPPEPWVNPDPAVAEAQIAYRAALAAARGPEPSQLKPSAPGPATFSKRPGFA